MERVTTDTLVVGIDIAKDFHVAQAATCRGVVLSRHALRVSNSAKGFAHLLRARAARPGNTEKNLADYPCGEKRRNPADE